MDEQLSIYEETHGDGHLRARSTDPWTSHASARKTEAEHGVTFIVTSGKQKHKILLEFGRAYPLPLTDHEVTAKASLSSPCPWRRVKDLLDGGFVQEVDTVFDPKTKRDVRRCLITAHGAKALKAIKGGARSYP